MGDELSTKFIGEDYGEEFSEKIDEMFSSIDSLSLNIEFNGELKRTTDKCYRQLQALMETLDSNLEYTGLTKVEGGSDGTEKSIEWVCELCKEGFQAEGRNYKCTSDTKERGQQLSGQLASAVNELGTIPEIEKDDVKVEEEPKEEEKEVTPVIEEQVEEPQVPEEEKETTPTEEVQKEEKETPVVETQEQEQKPEQEQEQEQVLEKEVDKLTVEIEKETTETNDKV